MEQLGFNTMRVGVRREKPAGGKLHEYFTDGTRILGERIGNDKAEYLYDQSGITGMIYNGGKYYFQKNPQGDILFIYNEAGRLLAKYSYDAWGNHKIYAYDAGKYIDITENGYYTTHIARINPFRYRGYYYDSETALYYLNSRYYDPATRRFINADDAGVVQSHYLTTLNGQNLYSYCLNNPVMHTDPDGNFVVESTAAIIIKAVIAFLALCVAILVLPSLWSNYQQAYKVWREEPTWMNTVSMLLDAALVVLNVIAIVSSFVSFASSLKSAFTYVRTQPVNPSDGFNYMRKMERGNQDIKVIGRLEDTSVAKNWPGHDVLNDPNWTLLKNDAWVKSGITNKQKFYIASPTTPQNLISSNPLYPGETVFARELRMIYEAGYTRIGDYLIP